METEYKVNIEAGVTSEDILKHIKQEYIIYFDKHKRTGVFIPMKKTFIRLSNGKYRPRFTWDIFKKAIKKSNKISNENFKRFTYKNKKNVGTIVYRNEKLFDNCLKYIIFVYQKEFTSWEQKLLIFKKYINDLSHIPFNNTQLTKQLEREYHIEELLKECDNIEKTKTVFIDTHAIKNVGGNNE